MTSYLDLTCPPLASIALIGILSACSAEAPKDIGNLADARAAEVADASSDASSEDCRRTLGAPNRERKMVVSRPYDDSGMQQSRWELLNLSQTAEITSTNIFFEMGRAVDGVVHFTPDGKLGFAAQQDGSIGVFKITDSGVTVLHKALTGSFYASEITVTPKGDQLLVLSRNWRNNGGGIYRLSIGCDDQITDEGLIQPAKLPTRPLWRENGDLLISANDLGTSLMDQDLLLIPKAQLGVTGGQAVATTIFPDRGAIVGSASLSADQHYALVGDTSAYSGVPNRVAVTRVGASSLDAVSVLTPIKDPSSIATSPYNDAAIVVSTFGDAIFKLTYDPSNDTQPYRVSGELSYSGGAPALPSSLVSINRGELLGTVLIAENQGIRRLVFEGNSIVSDKGRTAIGTSFAAIVGAIGVQP